MSATHLEMRPIRLAAPGFCPAIGRSAVCAVPALRCPSPNYDVKTGRSAQATVSTQTHCKGFAESSTIARAKFAGSTGPLRQNLELTFSVDQHRAESGLSPRLGIS
jgi:hypothetical protein